MTIMTTPAPHIWLSPPHELLRDDARLCESFSLLGPRGLFVRFRFRDKELGERRSASELMSNHLDLHCLQLATSLRFYVFT